MSNSPLNPASLVWAYLRVSGDEQARRATPIASQCKVIEDYCHQNDLGLLPRVLTGYEKDAG